MTLVTTKHIQPSDNSLPSLAIQITALVGSYMLWIGTTDLPSEQAELAPSRGALARDWACAMPPLASGIDPPATSLYRAPGSDVALSMAQRLARRFKKQIFLSVDVPPSFLSMGQGPKLLLEAEKALSGTLRDLQAESSTASS